MNSTIRDKQAGVLKTFQKGKHGGRKGSWISKTAAVLFWLLLWYTAAKIVDTEILIPKPLAVWNRLLALAGTADYWRTIAYSILRIFTGFALAFLTGVILAAAAYKSRGPAGFVLSYFKYRESDARRVVHHTGADVVYDRSCAGFYLVSNGASYRMDKPGGGAAGYGPESDRNGGGIRYGTRENHTAYLSSFFETICAGFVSIRIRHGLESRRRRGSHRQAGFLDRQKSLSRENNPGDAGSFRLDAYGRCDQHFTGKITGSGGAGKMKEQLLHRAMRILTVNQRGGDAYFLKNITKSYGDTYVLEKETIVLPRNGILLLTGRFRAPAKRRYSISSPASSARTRAYWKALPTLKSPIYSRKTVCCRGRR